MKLVIATDNFPPRWDGISRFLVNVIPLLKDTFEITVIHPDNGDFTLQNITQIKVPLSRIKIGDYRFPTVRPSLIREEVTNADIVFGQTIGPIGALAAKYASYKNKKYIPYIHSVEWKLAEHSAKTKFRGKIRKSLVKKIAKNIYNGAQEIYVPSKQTQEELYWNNIRRKTQIIRLGVDTQKFRPRQKKDTSWIEKEKEKLGIASEYIIGFHGRLAPEKDLITLLRGVKRLKRDDVRLLIIGDGVETIRGKLERDKHCITLNAKKNIEKYVRLFDIFVSPSLTETTSLSTVEALSSGIPVIATPAGYIPDYIEHGENGYTFPLRDSYTLSKIVDLLLQQEETRKRISKNGRRTAKEKFSWENTARNISKKLSAHIIK